MKAHQSTVGKNDEWLTPREILEPLGRFDLDPCAPVVRPWPTAAQHYTAIDDGLSKDWDIHVWCTIDEDDTIRPCQKNNQGQVKNLAQSAEWLSLSPLSISIPATTGLANLNHVAENVCCKTPESDTSEEESLDLVSVGNTQGQECNDAQNANPSIQQRLSFSDLRPHAAMGLLRGAESASERGLGKTEQNSERQPAAERKSSNQEKSTINQSLGNRQSVQTRECITPSVGSEKQDFHFPGPMPTGWHVSTLSEASAPTAGLQENYSKTTSFRSHILIVPELLSATWSQPAPHATAQKMPSIRIPGLRKQLLSTGLIGPSGHFVGHYKPRVWMNPPFNRYVRPLWMKKMADHNNGIMLVPAACETQAFYDHVWGMCAGVLMLKSRPHFCYIDGTVATANSGCTIALVAYGEKNLDCLRRSGLGVVLTEISPLES